MFGTGCSNPGGPIGAAERIADLAISKYALDIPFRPLIWLSALGGCDTAAGAVSRVVRFGSAPRKPLATLRPEKG